MSEKPKIFVLLAILQFFIRIEGKNIICETERDIEWNKINETLKTCEMFYLTTITRDEVTKFGTKQSSAPLSIESLEDSLSASTVVQNKGLSDLLGIGNAGNTITGDALIKALSFSNNKRIFFLPVKVAESFPNLMVYDTSRTSIKQISRKNFAGLKNLRLLAVSQNKIEKIGEKTFDDLVNLEVLQLNDNYLKIVPSNAFKNLGKLHIANFLNNLCIDKKFEGKSAKTSIQSAVGGSCDVYKTHDVSCGKIQVETNVTKICNMSMYSKIIDDDVKISNKDPEMIYMTYIDNENIHYLPIKVAESFPNLQMITASEIPLKKIAKKNFEGLTKLTNLTFVRCEIDVIPPDTFNGLDNLKSLDLYQNGIKFLSPDTFNNLNNLAKVYLLENICVDSEFTGSAVKTSVQQALRGKCDIYNGYENVCEFLKVDSISNFKTTLNTCFMRKVTKIFKDDTQLGTFNDTVTGINLFNNKNIYYLPVKVAVNFPNLIGYLASGLSIREISKKNFEGLSKLRILQVDENLIESVYTDTFEDLVNLEELSMHSNLIKFIAPETFENLIKLQWVNLQHNYCINKIIKSSPGKTAKTSIQKLVGETCSSFDDCKEIKY